SSSGPKGFEESDHVSAQGRSRPIGDRGPGAHEEQTVRHETGMLPIEIDEQRPQAPPDAVAADGGRRSPRDGERQATFLARRILDKGHRQRSPPYPDAVGSQGIELAAAPDPADQADSLARPL